MLNPQRWGASSTNSAANSGYVQDFEKGTDGALFDIGVDEDDEEDEPKTGGTMTRRKFRSIYIPNFQWC